MNARKGREGKGEKRKRINLSRATSSATMKRRADERGGEKRGWKGKRKRSIATFNPRDLGLSLT